MTVERRCIDCGTRITGHSRTIRRCRGCAARERSKDPEWRKNNAEAIRKLSKDPEWRRKQAEAMRKLWKDPEHRKKQADAMRKSWKDPEHRKNNAEAVRKFTKDPEWRRKNSEAVRKRAKDPEWQRRHTEAMRKRAKNPKWQRNHMKAMLLNGYGTPTPDSQGIIHPSKAEAESFDILIRLGANPRVGIPPLETPYGYYYPDTVLEYSVFDIPAGIPIELKDKDGSYPWSKTQLWAIDNGEIFLVVKNDLKNWAQEVK